MNVIAGEWNKLSDAEKRNAMFEHIYESLIHERYLDEKK